MLMYDLSKALDELKAYYILQQHACKRVKTIQWFIEIYLHNDVVLNYFEFANREEMRTHNDIDTNGKL